MLNEEQRRLSGAHKLKCEHGPYCAKVNKNVKNWMGVSNDCRSQKHSLDRKFCVGWGQMQTNALRIRAALCHSVPLQIVTAHMWIAFLMMQQCLFITPRTPCRFVDWREGDGAAAAGGKREWGGLSVTKTRWTSAAIEIVSIWWGTRLNNVRNETTWIRSGSLATGRVSVRIRRGAA